MRAGKPPSRTHSMEAAVMRLTMKDRRTLTKVTCERYRKASKKDKGRILDKFVKNSISEASNATVVPSGRGKCGDATRILRGWIGPFRVGPEMWVAPLVPSQVRCGLGGNQGPSSPSSRSSARYSESRFRQDCRMPTLAASCYLGHRGKASAIWRWDHE